MRATYYIQRLSSPQGHTGFRMMDYWMSYPVDMHKQHALAYGMADNRYAGFLDEHDHGFLVAFDLHWRIVEAKPIDPNLGAARALETFIAELREQGWRCEHEPTYGFVFMNRGRERILVEATPRNPADHAFQSFSPFKA